MTPEEIDEYEREIVEDTIRNPYFSKELADKTLAKLEFLRNLQASSFANLPRKNLR